MCMIEGMILVSQGSHVLFGSGGRSERESKQFLTPSSN